MSNNKCTSCHWAIVGSTISLIISGVCLFGIFDGSRLDYHAITISVLGILITILIGWQVYTIVDLKEMRKKLPGEINYLHNKIDYLEAVSKATNSGVMAYSILGGLKEGLLFTTLHEGLVSLRVLANFPDTQKECEGIKETMYELCVSPQVTLRTIGDKNLRMLLDIVVSISIKDDKMDRIETEIINAIQECQRN